MVENNKINKKKNYNKIINSIVFLGIVESNYLDLSVTSYQVVWMLIIWCCIGALCNIFLSIWLFWGIKGQVGKIGQSTSVITGTRPFIDNLKSSYCNKWVGVLHGFDGIKSVVMTFDFCQLLSMLGAGFFSRVQYIWKDKDPDHAELRKRDCMVLYCWKLGLIVKLISIKIVHAFVYLIKQIVVIQLPGSVLIAVLWVFFL